MPQFKVDITNEQVDILEDIIVDIEDWLNKAITEKISNALAVIAEKERMDLIKDGATSGPLDPKELANSRFTRPGYKKRKDRE